MEFVRCLCGDQDSASASAAHWESSATWSEFSIGSVNVQLGKCLSSSGFIYVKFHTFAWWPVWGWSVDHQLFNCGWSCTAQQLWRCFMMAENFYTSTGIVPQFVSDWVNHCIFPSLLNYQSLCLGRRKNGAFSGKKLKTKLDCGTLKCLNI